MADSWGDAELMLTPGRPSGQRLLFVGLPTPEAAAAAAAAMRGTCPPSLGGAGPLGITFAERCSEAAEAAAEAAAADGSSAEAPLVAVRDATLCGIPGLALLPDFVSPEAEAALVAAADGAAHWQLLAKRRVLHFGFTFDYETRGVGQPEHELPAAARALAGRIEALPEVLPLDQLTVNDYPCGVGISPHVGEYCCSCCRAAGLPRCSGAVLPALLPTVPTALPCSCHLQRHTLRLPAPLPR